MNELLGLPGSERYEACDDESAPKRPIRREKIRAGVACRQTGGQKQVYHTGRMAPQQRNGGRIFCNSVLKSESFVVIVHGLLH